MWAASGWPITSWLSASSLSRSATRTPTLARMRSLITPAGRWVASTRRSPSERPRAAMSTMPSTNSGISLARVANSSTTISRSSGAAPVPPAQLGQVARAGLGQELLAATDLGVERLQDPPGQVLVEVGDDADAVRQPLGVLERRAPLVVDQQEADAARRVLRGQRGDHRLQQLALAGRRWCRRPGRASPPGPGRARPGRPSRRRAGRPAGRRAPTPTAGARRPGDATSGSRSSSDSRSGSERACWASAASRSGASDAERSTTAALARCGPGTVSRLPPACPTSSAARHPARPCSTYGALVGTERGVTCPARSRAPRSPVVADRPDQ